MVIKCKKCEKDNPVGNIFCRLCGAKLDTEDIDRDIKKHLKKRMTVNFFSGFFRLVLVIFFLLAFYGAYLIFEPVKYFRPIPALPRDQEPSTMALYDRINMRMPGTYKFTGEQLSYLASRIFAKKDNTVTISFPENKYFGFTITKNLINYSSVKLDVRVTAVCELVIEKDKRGKNVLTANFNYLKLGELKLPEWYNQLFIDDFKPYLSNKKVEGFLKKINAAKIADNQIAIVLTD